MKIVIQRVSEASVTIEDRVVARIGKGILILLGIAHNDSQEDIEYLVRKVVAMRIFSDHEGKMNLSIEEVKGDMIVVSQFTLHAQTKKGNRPSYIDAARPEQAIPLYEKFVKQLKNSIGSERVSTGEFGADMQVQLINDGPVTIIMDSKER